MNRTETLQLLKEMDYAYGNVLKTNSENEIQGKIDFFLRMFKEFEYTDIINGFYAYCKSDSARYAPSIKQLIDFARMNKRYRESKQGIKHRRIVTPEEDMANEYAEIMTKVKKTGVMSEEDRRILQIEKKYYLMFYGEEKDKNYEVYFGKTREEFERLD